MHALNRLNKIFLSWLGLIYKFTGHPDLTVSQTKWAEPSSLLRMHVSALLQLVIIPACPTYYILYIIYYISDCC